MEIFRIITCKPNFEIPNIDEAARSIKLEFSVTKALIYLTFSSVATVDRGPGLDLFDIAPVAPNFATQ